MSVKRYKVEELNCCFDADMVESPTGEYVKHFDYASLKAENERLIKAGDTMARIICPPTHGGGEWDGEWDAWNAAKEGKPSV